MKCLKCGLDLLGFVTCQGCGHTNDSIDGLAEDALHEIDVECPFCGSKDSAEIICEEGSWAVVCSIFKLGCGASTGRRSREQGAIKAWNKRASSK